VRRVGYDTVIDSINEMETIGKTMNPEKG